MTDKMTDAQLADDLTAEAERHEGSSYAEEFRSLLTQAAARLRALSEQHMEPMPEYDRDDPNAAEKFAQWLYRTGNRDGAFLLRTELSARGATIRDLLARAERAEAALSEQQGEAFAYWVPNARVCSDGSYEDGPGDLVFAEDASESCKINGAPLYTRPHQLSEQQGEAVVIVQEGTRVALIEGLPHQKRFHVRCFWDLPEGTKLYTRPQPAAGDAVRLHEVACDLQYLFGRASLEGHEVGQRLAKETRSKMEAALSAAPAPVVPEGVRLIAAERQRQVDAEGWSAEHDDAYGKLELVRAAVAYALYGVNQKVVDDSFWPWHLDWWKPADRVRNLVKAGALIAAEIDRLNRAAAKSVVPEVDVEGACDCPLCEAPQAEENGHV